MSFLAEFLLKFGFWAAFAAILFFLAIRFPRPLPNDLFSRIWDLRSPKGILFLMLAVFGGLVVAILVMLAAYSMFGNGMKFYYIGIVALYFFFLFWRSPVLSTLTQRVRLICIVLLSIPFGSLWIAYPSWLTYSFTALVCGYVLLSSVNPVKADPVIAILTAVIAYDTWGVLGPSSIGGGAIVQVSSNISFTPAGLIMSPWGGMLGIGDIVLPGIIVMLAKSYGLAIETILGWIAGLFLIFTLSAILRAALPATILLVPATLFAFLFTANRKHINLVWR